MKLYSFILPIVMGAFFVWGVAALNQAADDVGVTIVNDTVPIEHND